MRNKIVETIVEVFIFAVAFAFVESAVVVYLRALYYPSGFVFPLRTMSPQIVQIELVREAATIVMLASAGMLAGSSRWSRFGFFMFAFGIWDIFYYVWLKVLLNWPATIFDWDILFLLPMPWIGPVIAPVTISLLMIISALIIIQRENVGRTIHPSNLVWLLTAIGTGLALFSFLSNSTATLQFQRPHPYHYSLFCVGIGFYIAAMCLFLRKNALSVKDSLE
jgi:hypothetical protein